MRQRTNDASDISLPSSGYVARTDVPGPPIATCMHQILAVVIAAYIANSHQFFSCCNYILWNTCVKFQILSKSFTTSLLTFMCSSEKNGFVRFNIQCVEKISCPKTLISFDGDSWLVWSCWKEFSTTIPSHVRAASHSHLKIQWYH